MKGRVADDKHPNAGMPRGKVMDGHVGTDALHDRDCGIVVVIVVVVVVDDRFRDPLA